MAKRMTVVWMVIWMGGSVAGAVTNLSQCIGIELTPAVLSEFPERDNSTPETCMLGFVKGVVTGDLPLFLAPLSDELRAEEAGVSALSMLTPAMTNDFRNFVLGEAFSNHVVRSCAETVSGGEATIRFSMESQSGVLVKTGEMRATLSETGGEWRITEWDVDE